LGGAVGYIDLMGNHVQPRTSFVGKFMFIKPNNIDAQEQQSHCQDFNNIACKEEGTDQENQKDGDEIIEKKEKKKDVGYYHILMALKLKRKRG
jgi:hypothetical protein